MPTELAVVFALFLVFLNGFFVAAEFALVKVRHTRIVQLVDEGKSTAKMAHHAITHLDAYLSATQLGITLASLGLGWIGEPAFAVILEPLFAAAGTSEAVSKGISFAVAFTVISILHIVLGELAPKSWAIQKPEKVSLGIAFPLHWFYVLFKPAIIVLNGLAGRVLKLVGIRPASEHEMAHSQEEISMLLSASGESGVLKESEVDIVKHVFRFGDKNAGDVMLPRVDIAMIRADWSVKDAADFALSHPFSRYPITDGDADSIQGMVHIKDLLRLERDGGELASIRRDVLMVPESRPLDDLLRDFQKERTHMAIVVDEYGGTAGLVTLEDVLEQIVGSIVDETDVFSPEIETLSEGVFLIKGVTRLDTVNENLGTEFESEDFESLGGLIYSMLDGSPEKGRSVDLDGWSATVEDVKDGRVARVRLEMRVDSSPES